MRRPDRLFLLDHKDVREYIQALETVARAARALHFFYADDEDDARIVDEEQALQLIAALSKIPPLPESES